MKLNNALSVNNIRQLDKHAVEELGIPGYQLMENAGNAVAELIAAKYPAEYYPLAVVVCGKGNNGGDGFVIARLLKNIYNYQVRVIVLGSISTLKTDPLIHFQNIYHDLTISFVDKQPLDPELIESLRAADIVVDAIFGTGLQGKVTGINREVIELTNSTSAVKVCVDIPSGIHGDNGPLSETFIQATDTVTFVAAKIAMENFPALFGNITVADIGIPLE